MSGRAQSLKLQRSMPPPRLCLTSGVKEGRDLGSEVWSEDPRGCTGKNSYPAVYLGMTAPPLQGQKNWWQQDDALFPSIGTKTPAGGSKPWCQILAALYNKLWNTAQLGDQFLGQTGTSNNKARPSPRWSMQVLAVQISKIWCLITQPHA